MKKTGLLLGLLALVACEQQELEYVMDDMATYSVQTKSASSIADFNVVAELEKGDVLVNIVNGSNSKYLSMDNNKQVELKSSDSDKGRWKFRNGRIAYGGDFSPTGFDGEAYLTCFPNGDYPVVGVSTIMYPNVAFAMYNQNGDDYNIGVLKTGIISGSLYKYLMPKSKSSSSLIFKDELSDLSYWQFHALGEYELEKIEYVRTTVDDFNLVVITADRDEYVNDTDVDQPFTYNLSMNFQESSNFSKTEGITISRSSGLSVGLPNLLGEGSTIGFNSTIQSQSTKSYTFGGNESKTITRTKGGEVTVPPHKAYRVDMVMYTYSGELTYVATMKNVETGKSFKVKGKWSGDCFAYYRARVYDVTDGEDVLVNETDEEN